MHFILFLFLLLFVLVAIPVLLVANKVRKIKKTFRQNMNGQNRTRQSEPEQPAKKKVFAKDVGEYVHFEDIKVDESEQKEKKRPETNYSSEPQISDVEFEEIKD